jgi:hypothetical protein
LSLEADVGKPLLDVLRDVVLDPAEQAAFTADPATYLAEYGYDGVSPDDLSEAFGLVADTLPPDVAQAVAAAAPPPSSAPEAEFAVGEGDGAAFGDVNGDFDTVALGGPDTFPDADADDLRFDEGDTAGEAPEVGDRPAAFGEGSDDFELADDSSAGFYPEPDPDFGGVEAEVETVWAVDPEPAPDYPDDDLDAPDTFAPDDAGLGDDPSDFIDDVGSF